MEVTSFTDIVELPAIRKKDGSLMMNLEIMRMSDKMRHEVANFLGGNVVWPKLRATYTPIEQSLCDRRACYNIKETCPTHAK